MRKLILVLWLLAAIGFTACSGGKGILYNGKGVVEIERSLLQGIVGYDQTKPLYYSADIDNWLKDGKLKESVGRVRDNGKGSYVAVRGMSGKQFQLFQVAQKEDGTVDSVVWLADITAEPKLHLRTIQHKETATETDTIVKTPERQTITGRGNGNQVVGFWVKAQKLDSTFDDYGNVEFREALDTRYVISWDVDALGHTDEIRQFNFTNQDGHGPSIVAVDPGENSVVVDVRQGKQLMLYSQNAPAMIINPLKLGDLHLVGLDKVKYDGKDYLEITTLSAVKLKTLSEMLKDNQAKAKPVKKIKKHYTVKQMYPNGYYWVVINEMNATLYDQCYNAGKIKKDWTSIRVGKEWLAKYGSAALKEAYKDKLVIPE